MAHGAAGLLAHKRQQVEQVVLSHERCVYAGDACGFSLPPYCLAPPPSSDAYQQATYRCTSQQWCERRGTATARALMASGGRSTARACRVQRACGPSNPVRHNGLLLHLHPSILQPSTAVHAALSTAPRRAAQTCRTRFSTPGADSVPAATMVLQLLLPLEPTQNEWRSFDSFGPNQAGAVPQSLSVQGVLAQPKPGADLSGVARRAR